MRGVSTPVYSDQARRERLHARRPRRAPVLLGTAVVVAVLLGVLAVGVGAVYFGVYQEARLGRRDLQAATAAVQHLSLDTPAPQLAAAEESSRRAGHHFRTAGRNFDSNPLLSLGTHVPVVGPQLKASRKLISIATHAATAAEVTARAGPRLLNEDQHTGNPGRRIVNAIQEAGPNIDRINTEMAAIASERAAINAKQLWPALRAPIAEIDAAVARASPVLKEYPFWRDAALSILGSDRPRTYLVLNQDSAEIRATGGFIGSVGFLRINAGQVGQFEFKDVYNFEPDLLRGHPNYVAPPPALQQFIRERSWALRDANWSPDFPTSVDQIKFFLQRELGMTVDGVIAIDPFLVEKLLTITGPITIPEVRDTFDSANFLAKSIQHAEFSGRPNAVRKDFLGLIGIEIEKRIFSLDPKAWPKLSDILRDACQTRDLQVQFDQPAARALVDRFECTGAMRVTTGDYLMSVDTNLNAWKNNFWLDRSFKLALDVQANGTVRHTLTIRYVNGTPRNQPAPYYNNYLRIYLPKDTELVTVGGDGLTNRQFTRGADRGYAQLSGSMSINPGAVWTVRVVYDVPNLGAATYRLFWQKQAGTRADSAEVTFMAPPGARLEVSPPTSVNGARAEWRARLDRDLGLSVSY